MMGGQLDTTNEIFNKKTDSHARLSQELTNYISLLIMKLEIESEESSSQEMLDTVGKANEVTQRIFSSENGIQALIQVVQAGRKIFDTNLEALIRRRP